MQPGIWRIWDLARAPWILCSQKSGSFGHIWEVEKPSAGCFFCPLSLALAWSSNFHRPAFFFVSVSPGHASALSSCSRKRYLKHKVPRAGCWFMDESSSWEIWICHTSLSISIRSCVCHIFQDYFRLFFIVWQEPCSADQWAAPSLEWMTIYLVCRLFHRLLVPSREGCYKEVQTLFAIALQSITVNN